MSRTSLLALVVCALLTGCSDDADRAVSGPSQPPESAFAEGTCRVVAPDVLQIGRAAGRLGDGGAVDKGVLEQLEQAQTRLRPVVEAAEPSYKPALDKLVVAVGLVRFQASAGRYQTPTGDNLERAYDEAVRACTRPSSS